MDIYSDGAAQHFKSKYMWVYITSLLEKGIRVAWHYTATSHGKGAVDGIGGRVKRAVHSAIMACKYNVCDAQGTLTVLVRSHRVSISCMWILLTLTI
jgi:hypothetical protein